MNDEFPISLVLYLLSFLATAVGLIFLFVRQYRREQNAPQAPTHSVRRDSSQGAAKQESDGLSADS